MRRLIRKLLVTVISLSICIQIHFASAGIAQDIQIHYLGHAGFLFQFSNGMGVVADYATFHDIGDFKPDVATYSHGHDDHAGGVLPRDMRRDHVLSNSMSLEMNGLSFSPIVTSESYAGSNDNQSYLITYQGFNILHLGDAQADISAINSEAERALLKRILSEKIDLLLVPIGNGVCGITNAEVADFIDFVHPRRVIPMHYWHFWEKWFFLRHMEGRNQSNGQKYIIRKIDGPKWSIDISQRQQEGVIEIIALEDADYN